jgi:hypothetical protein
MQPRLGQAASSKTGRVAARAIWHHAQCLNLEDEIHHTASKPCIFGFEPLK